jgi:hypothetical protein
MDGIELSEDSEQPNAQPENRRWIVAWGCVLPTILFFGGAVLFVLSQTEGIGFTMSLLGIREMRDTTHFGFFACWGTIIVMFFALWIAVQTAFDALPEPKISSTERSGHYAPYDNTQN